MIFFKALLLGFAIAAPVGPIGLFCIQKTLSNGRLSGFFAGFGAAFADGVYGLIAAFGLGLVSNFLINNQVIIKTFGGLFLIYLGIDIFSKRNEKNNNLESAYENGELVKDFLTTFILTFTNPVTILAFISIFISLDLVNTDSSPFTVVLGVFLGSLIWWTILCIITSLFKRKIKLKYVNLMSSIIISAFGILSIFSIY